METINTLDAKGEVLITIMASLAQQESQSMSQNIKLGLQYRYQQGKFTSARQARNAASPAITVLHR